MPIGAALDVVLGYGVRRRRHRSTEAADVFPTVADEILRRLAPGREEARAIGDGHTRTLRFAATHAWSNTFSPGWLRGFTRWDETGSVSLIADNKVACPLTKMIAIAEPDHR